MKFLLSSFFSVFALTSIVAAQSLPQGKWRMEEYRFGPTSEHTLKGVNTTLVVRSDGKLGGDSGCNAYGGSYSIDKRKLAITDIISTMRACEEPTPQFESSYFRVLRDASRVELKKSELTLIDPATHNFLRFQRSND